MMDKKVPESRLRVVTLTGGIDVLLTANPRRRGFTLYPSRTVGMTLGDRDMLNSLVGANIPFSGIAIHYCKYLQGSWVESEVLVLGTGAGTCAVLEVLE